MHIKITKLHSKEEYHERMSDVTRFYRPPRQEEYQCNFVNRVQARFAPLIYTHANHSYTFIITFLKLLRQPGLYLFLLTARPCFRVCRQYASGCKDAINVLNYLT